MKEENVHLLIDMCAEGARLNTYFPSLEKGLAPRDIRVAEQIQKLSKIKERVQVSDISVMLEVTRPGISISLKTLTQMGFVEKEHDKDDGRIVYIRLTEAGEELVRRTVTDFHRALAETIYSEFDDEEVCRAAEIIHRAVELTRDASAAWDRLLP